MMPCKVDKNTSGCLLSFFSTEATVADTTTGGTLPFLKIERKFKLEKEYFRLITVACRPLTATDKQKYRLLKKSKKIGHSFFTCKNLETIFFNGKNQTLSKSSKKTKKKQ